MTIVKSGVLKIGQGLSAIREIGRMRRVTSEDETYYGEFLSALREAVSVKGSELALGINLFGLVVSCRAQTAVEIGRYKGFSTLALAGGLRFVDYGWNEPADHQQRIEIDYQALHQPKRRTLYSIDQSARPEAQARIERNGLSKYVEFINGDSHTVPLEVTADVLFIDGDHSYEGCSADLDRFVPMLRRGGYLILHDYFGYFDSRGTNGSPVKTLCDELAAAGGFEHLLIDTLYMSFVVLRKL